MLDTFLICYCHVSSFGWLSGSFTSISSVGQKLDTYPAQMLDLIFLSPFRYSDRYFEVDTEKVVYVSKNIFLLQTMNCNTFFMQNHDSITITIKDEHTTIKLDGQHNQKFENLIFLLRE